MSDGTEMNTVVAIVSVLVKSFFPLRGLAVADEKLQPAAPPTDDAVANDCTSGRFFLDGVMTGPRDPRDPRDWVAFLIIPPESAAAQYKGQLKKALSAQATRARTAAREGRLRALYLVVEEKFFGRGALLAAVEEFRADLGADLHVVRHYVFSSAVPEHVSVPRHRVLPAEEAAALLVKLKVEAADLPLIYATDPPIIWADGRPGQIVEVTFTSETAGEAVEWRLIRA
jgi:DNA-directed RNA polymerase subunit H (RpoH/RPB5)